MSRVGGRPGSDTGSDALLFDRLYEAHSRALYAYFLGGVGDRDLAADLLQETFVRVWRHINDLHRIPGERQPFWLFAVARNLLTDHRRRKAPSECRAAYKEAAAARPPDDPAADPVRALEVKEDARAVDAAVARLPGELRVVLALHLLTGLTSAQIGQLLGRPAGTVRYQIARARRRLAEDLGLSPTRGSDKGGSG
jgi:RNA polymerase sigma-70 factor (ECF subfamily)